jgi:hypothetical protein
MQPQVSQPLPLTALLCPWQVNQALGGVTDHHRGTQMDMFWHLPCGVCVVQLLVCDSNPRPAAGGTLEGARWRQSGMPAFRPAAGWSDMPSLIAIYHYKCRRNSQGLCTQQVFWLHVPQHDNSQPVLRLRSGVHQTTEWRHVIWRASYPHATSPQSLKAASSMHSMRMKSMGKSDNAGRRARVHITGRLPPRAHGHR